MKVEQVLHEPGGYVTYVFEILKKGDRNFLQSDFIMCVQYPNWDHRDLRVGEEGYLCYRDIQEGLDKYFDGKNMVSYKYSTTQFMKFVPKAPQHDCIMD